MATYIADRSTYWAVSDGPKVNNTPYADGDYRYYWKIYYEQTDEDKKPWNNRSKVIVKYYVQTYKSTSVYADVISYPSGTSTTKIDNVVLKSFNTSSGDIVVGDNYSLKYIGEASKYVYHNTIGDGSFTWNGSGFGMGTATSTYTLPHINRYSTLGDISTFDIDTGTTISVSTYVESFYNKLEIIVASKVVRTINGVKDDVEIIFTEDELDKIYDLVPKGDTADIIFRLTTYTNSSMGTTVGTDTKTVTGNFTIVLPTVNGAICTDSTVGMDNYTGDTTMQTIVNNISIVNVEIPASMGAVANTRGATIVEYIIDGKHIDYNASGISIQLIDEDAEGNPVYNAKYVNKDYITIYAVDSRGTSSLPYIQKFTNYIDYQLVTIDGKNATITRDDNGVSRMVTVSFEGTWWQGNFGVVENSLRTEVYYRDANEGYWTDPNEFVDGAEIGSLDETLLDVSTPNTFKYTGPINSNEDDKGFDIETPFDVIVAVYDIFNNRVLMITVEYGEPAIAIYKNKAALGGPYDESLGGTQVWDEFYIDGEKYQKVDTQRHIVSAYLENNWSNSFTAWTSYVVPLDTATVIGDKLTFENSAIIIGEGVSKIRMSGSVYFSGDVSDTQLRMWTRVLHTDGSEFTIPSYGYAPSAGTNMLITTPPVIVDVVPGETVDILAQIGKTAEDEILARGTTIYVEVIE